MATLSRFPEHRESKNKRLNNIRNLPTINEHKDKMRYKVLNSNEDDSQHKIRQVGVRQFFFPIYIYQRRVFYLIFYENCKYIYNNVRNHVWKPQHEDANAKNDCHLKLRSELERAHISVWDWLKAICLIFARKPVIFYERVIFYVPIFITNNKELIFDQKSQDLIDKQTGEIEDLKKRNTLLTEKLKENDDFLKARASMFYREKNKMYQERVELRERNRCLKNELIELKTKLEQLKVKYKEVLHDLGKLSVERSADINRMKKANSLKKIFQLETTPTHVMLSDENRRSSTSGCNETMREKELHCQHNKVRHCRTQDSTNKSPDSLIPTTSTSNQQTSNFVDDLAKSFAKAPEMKNKSSAEKHFICELPEKISVAMDNRTSLTGRLSLPVEVEEPRGKESISIINYEPCSVVTAEVRNIYKLLLLTMADRLLLSDIVKLNDWANERFSIPTSLSATDVVLCLDQKGIICASDLSQLHAFFESILRFDLVYLIDQFCSGDYPFLRKLIYSNNPGSETSMHNSNKLRRSGVAPTYSNPRRALGARGNAEVVSDGQVGSKQRENMGYANGSSSSDTPTTSGVHAMKMLRSSSKDTSAQNPQKNFHGASQSRPNDSQSSRKGNTHEQKWLCSHYKRRCYVKFECCNKFWPCHRCHNNESTCGRKKLKSRDTTMVKCAECGKEQQFGENNQFCVSCNIKFADFYCGLCKHLTGMDDHPYHCDKCGICRIHGDRSFHCDVCGVCLDVQLRGNHKCREGSAHDECCICLEDAFTGCQILPCSHKVHKNCATQMIQSGITRCPICRESFAHVLKKRSSPKKNTKR